MSLAKRFSGYLALRNDAAPAAGTGECRLYSQSGVAKVIQPDGTIVTLANEVVRSVQRATPFATPASSAELVVVSMPIAANSLVVGSVFRVSYLDDVGNNVDQPTFRFRMGPNGTTADPAVVTQSQLASSAASVVNAQWTVAMQTVGASATFFVGGIARSLPSTVTTPSAVSFNSTVASFLTLTVQAVLPNSRNIRSAVIDRVSG